MGISVLLPVYNETNMELEQSINSILNQTINDIELIIIDDNPQLISIHRFLHRISIHHKEIKIIFNKQSLGPSISVNKAIKMAKYSFIARMDADDICKRTRLRKQYDFLIKNNLDLVCSNFCGFIDSKNHNYVSKPYYDGMNDIVDQSKIKNILSYHNIAMGPTLFFKKRAFIQVSGYRNILSEDYDLVTRFIIKGFKVGYDSSVLLLKRNRINNLSNNNSLNEFISTYLISKSVRKTNYLRPVSLHKICNSLENVNNKDKDIFYKFKKNFNKYKKTKSLFYLLKSIMISLFSLLVFKRNIWIIKIKIYNKYKL